MIGLYTKNDVLITRLVDNVICSLNVIINKNRLLNGQWFVQTIGEPAKVAKVKVSLTLQEKETLDTIYGLSDLLKVIFDGKYYVGLIDGEIDYERQKFTALPMFVASFTILVKEDGDSV